MISLDKKELQSIVILKHNPDFQTFMDVLNRSLTTAALQGATIKDDTLSKWNQGKVQELLDIINKIKTADEELRSYNQGARKPNIG